MRKRLLYTASLALLLALGAAACGDDGGSSGSSSGATLSFKPLDAGGPLTKAALTKGDIQVALVCTSDADIAVNKWVLLEDDQQMLAADNIVPVVSDEVLEAYGDELGSLVDSVSQALTTEALIELNRQYDIEKEDADAIAAGWIEENM